VENTEEENPAYHTEKTIAVTEELIAQLLGKPDVDHGFLFAARRRLEEHSAAARRDVEIAKRSIK
jgi:hypothetical protein